MSVSWHDMFALGVPLLEKILRPILVYIFLLVGLRLAGKRELAQLNAFDLIVLLTISNTVQNAIIGDDTSVSGGMIGAATLLAINYLVVRFMHGHKSLDRIVEGSRDCLVHNGRIRRGSLNRELMTRAELVAAAHKQGITSLADVESAYLEPTGTITFTTRKPSDDDMRHHELMDAIDQLRHELAARAGQRASDPAAG